MDTRLCDAAFALADQADMLVCECTFAETEAGFARDYGHLYGPAGRLDRGGGRRAAARSHAFLAALRNRRNRATGGRSSVRIRR